MRILVTRPDIPYVEREPYQRTYVWDQSPVYQVECPSCHAPPMRDCMSLHPRRDTSKGRYPVRAHFSRRVIARRNMRVEEYW